MFPFIRTKVQGAGVTDANAEMALGVAGFADDARAVRPSPIPDYCGGE